MKSKTIHKLETFPIFVYITLVLILCLIGLGVSVYLAVSHYKVYTDIGYASFCAISNAINCDTVSQSSFSIFGSIPVPVWGIFGYIFTLTALAYSYDRKTRNLNLIPFLLVLGSVLSLISLWFAIISAVYIKIYCIMCIVTYAVNFLILYMFWLIWRRFGKGSLSSGFSEGFTFLKANRLKALRYFLPILILLIGVYLSIPRYWQYAFPDIDQKKLSTGVTEDGSPWIGADNPSVTIIEYADYMCFQCQKLHYFIRRLITAHPDQIRLVHKHYPMDRDANPALSETHHPGSAVLSLVAIHAQKKGKFWQVNDLLYHYETDRGAIFLNEIAEAAGLELRPLKTGIHKPDIKRKLQNDILSGLKLNITGTPTYVINGKVYPGKIPMEILKFATQ